MGAAATPPGRLAGRVAVVTGGTDGIGRATAGLFVREGARLIVVARRHGPGAAVEAELGRERARFVAGDVADAVTAARAVGTALEAFGRLDVLVNNAAMDLSGVSVLDTPLETARRVFDVNLFGALSMLTAAASAMSAGGSIVNVTSRTALVGVPGMGVYGASKGALLALTRAAAVELARSGIRVNAVAPGPVGTPLMRA